MDYDEKTREEAEAIALREYGSELENLRDDIRTDIYHRASQAVCERSVE